MLSEVRIEQLAVIDGLEVHFEPGFTALTGETGAGKSLLLSALQLVAGGRANTEAIRPGAEQALVEARLVLQDAAAIARLRDEGYGDGPEVVVRRLLGADGNHRVYLNGRMATAQLLADVVGPELEIHAQHSQQRLLDAATQGHLLDRYGGHDDARAEVAAAYRAWQVAVQERHDLSAKGAQRDRELDWLRFQLDEFARLEPAPAEDETLRAQLQRIRGAATVQQAAAEAQAVLGEGEGCALDRLFSAEAALRAAARHDESLAPLRERLDGLAAELQDVVRTLQRRGGDDDEAADVAALEDRLSDLDRLARKHGGDLVTALAERDRLRGELAALEDLDAQIAALDERIAALEAAYRRHAEALSAARQVSAAALAETVSADLHQLDMPHALFAVGGWGEGAPGPSGLDRVDFRLAANPGDPPRALKKVASGGELSRVLLAIQNAVGTDVPGATVIFDEVDAGVGGETAMVVGRRMRALGRHNQVLAVTHTPQVAAHAHHQLHLAKAVVEGRAQTHAATLDDEARRQELARMLGSRADDSAHSHARTLLKAAQEAEIA